MVSDGDLGTTTEATAEARPKRRASRPTTVITMYVRAALSYRGCKTLLCVSRCFYTCLSVRGCAHMYVRICRSVGVFVL